VRHAQIDHQRIAGDVLQRVGLRHAAGGATDDDAERSADLEVPRFRRNHHERAAGGERVARLDVEHRCDRRRLVRRAVHRITKCRQRVGVVQQRAIHDTRQAPRRRVERQSKCIHR